MKEKLPFKNEYEKLELLLSQGQFELLPEEKEAEDIRLVYLMNDAAESFLVFCRAKLTGTYLPDFQGELWADLDVYKRQTMYIVLSLIKKGDICVTQDYGVAAMILGKGAVTI